jgi:multiple sugar transport system substrate-binding protein/sn-glycerol 3-phosphate transport system substrate-binding protein
MIVALLLSACTPATPEPTKEPEPEITEEVAEPVEPEEPEEPEMPVGPYEEVDPSGQTIIYWHQHSREREEGLLAMVEEFNTTNEWGITVQAEYQGGYGDIFNKMLVVLNTPDAPNVVVAYQNQAFTYAVADAMVDMNGLVDSPKWGLTEDEKADYFPGFYAQDIYPSFENARYGFPLYRSMELMYYNADWLKELKDAGAIDFDGPPQTPEQFKAAACAAVENPFSKAVAEGPMGYELSVDASRFASWTFAFGGNVFDYSANEYTFNSEAGVEAMTFMQDLFDSGCATIVTESYGDQTDFGTGKLLFTVGSTSGLPYYGSAIEAGAGEFEWNVAPVPHTTADPVTNIYGASNSIPKTTPEGELAAWLFLKFMADPAQQAAWAELSNYFPVRFSVADSLGDLFASLPQYETGYSFLQYGIFEPPVPGYDFARDKIEEGMAAIVDGADVVSTLDKVNEESNVILGEYQFVVPEPVPTPTPEPTPVPIGTEDNPIIWAFVPSGEMERVSAGADSVAAMILEETGLYVETFVATEYAGVIEAMCSDPPKAHMGSLATFAYILAADKGCAEAELVSVRFGLPTYNGQIFVRADSGITTLEELAGKTFCAGDPLSTSGWIIPSITLKAAGVDPDTDLEVVWTGSHDASVAGVYNGDCDAGSSYVDARTRIEADYPDVMEVISIIALSEDIPNDGVQYAPSVPREIRDMINEALLKIAETEEGQEALDTAYQWGGLQAITDAFYDAFRQVLDAAGVSAEDYQ